MTAKQKQPLRQKVLAQRAQLSAQVIARCSEKICQRLQQQWAQFACRQVFLFYPLPYEPDLRVLANFFWQQHVPVALPKTQGDTLVFYRWQQHDLLQTGRFKVQESTSKEVLIADAQTLVCVPCLALDARGNRLGYGKGYYDRFLAKHSAVSVGVCYQCFLFPVISCDADDRPVDFLLTEDKLSRC